PCSGRVLTGRAARWADDLTAGAGRPGAHRSGCSLGGRSARWRYGDGLPVLWPVASAVGLLAGRTI
ncbi:MAG: hypothetical protein ACR2LP_07405, partial [Candidatus Limnocylindrales bacterium]